jgi:hypothetical protein
MKKTNIFIIVLALGLILAGFWYYQRGFFSKDALKLEILGPSETELADEVEYIVKYKNNGNIRLEQPKLIFEFPKNSVAEGENFLRKEINLDDIYPGEEKTISLKARLFGTEGEAKVAKAQISYNLKDLKAGYTSDTTFTTLIKAVPITFEFDLPSRAESDKELKFRLNYFSNVDYPLSDLGIKINYPSGFDFSDSKPKALDKTEWNVGLLNRADGGRIEVSGNLKGEIGESKLFQAELGMWQDGEFISLKKATRGIEIMKSSFYVVQEINNNPQYIANSGDLLDYQITFKNIGDKVAQNLFLIVNFDGDAFDLDSLKVDSGRFEKDDKRIIWDYTMISDLKNLLPTEEGQVEFWVKVKDDLPPDMKNLTIKDTVSLDNFKEEFSTKVNSKVEVLQEGYFQDEIFGNSGPVPPAVGQTTTYTVIWQVKNYNNDIKNVKVKAILPQWVRLTGEIFPKDAKFSFDSASREIVWDVGELMTAGSGASGPGPNVAFQVAFLPDSSQGGQAPEIVSEARLTAEDTWTETTLERSALAITTNSIGQGSGIVQ